MRYLTSLLLLITLLFPLSASPAHLEFQGDGFISLKNIHSEEEITVQYRKSNGAYNAKALRLINQTLRCRLTGEGTNIPIALLELIDVIQDHFGGKQLHVISGYRSPSLNEKLRAQGRKVAKNSLHMRGKAMDIRIPGVSTGELKSYALSLKRGGVGYYPSNQFVHVDIGRVRQW